MQVIETIHVRGLKVIQFTQVIETAHGTLVMHVIETRMLFRILNVSEHKDRTENIQHTLKILFSS